METNHEDTFVRKLQEYEALIRYAAKRYSVPGVLDKEDLFQEGCLILHGMFSKYDFEPDSVDFRKMFKTELWHGLWKELHRTKMQKRDHKRLATDDISDLEDENTECFYDSDKQPTPEQEVLNSERVSVVDEFVKRLSDRLDDDAKVVLNEVLHPRTWDDVPLEYKRNLTEDSYWRVPKRVPMHVYARIIGIPLMSVRRALTRVRRCAAELGSELGLADTDAILGLKKRSEDHV